MGNVFELRYLYFNMKFCLWCIPNMRTDITKTFCIEVCTEFASIK